MAVSAGLIGATVLPASRASAYDVIRGRSGESVEWQHSPSSTTQGGSVNTWCGWVGKTHSGLYTPCDIDTELVGGKVAGSTNNFEWDANWISSWNAVRDGAWWITEDTNGLVFHLHDVPNVNRNDDIALDGSDLGYCTGCSLLLGTTQTSWWEPSGEVNAAWVDMNSNHGVPWAYTTSADSGHFRFTQVLAHELGHAVGEAHSAPGPNIGRVMECTTARGENLGIPLDADTTYGAYYLYAADHNVWGSPTPVSCASNTGATGVGR